MTLNSWLRNGKEKEERTGKKRDKKEVMGGEERRRENRGEEEVMGGETWKEEGKRQKEVNTVIKRIKIVR